MSNCAFGEYPLLPKNYLNGNRSHNPSFGGMTREVRMCCRAPRQVPPLESCSCSVKIRGGSIDCRRLTRCFSKETTETKRARGSSPLPCCGGSSHWTLSVHRLSSLDRPIRDQHCARALDLLVLLELHIHTRSRLGADPLPIRVESHTDRTRYAELHRAIRFGHLPTRNDNPFIQHTVGRASGEQREVDRAPVLRWGRGI